ncbi:hypothetical protein O181_036840 [Austropuccinia psidii MF-1]|uniref:Uncharacterized protein n=1 Tax=Austropuccinia psidii MF-1 TaxID=1389203 RepID=A0A9Q3HCJ4_9BASI|nr:hypothetical protein [Austropuccinia psidii MF-1]
MLQSTLSHSGCNQAATCASPGVYFCPLLPYLLQANGKVESLNQMLSDMARAMMEQRRMPACFWQFAYTLACFMHNHSPNSQCMNSSPHQELYGQALTITTLYPFGAEAIIYMLAMHQQHKLALRAIDC